MRNILFVPICALIASTAWAQDTKTVTTPAPTATPAPAVVAKPVPAKVKIITAKPIKVKPAAKSVIEVKTTEAKAVAPAAAETAPVVATETDEAKPAVVVATEEKQKLWQAIVYDAVVNVALPIFLPVLSLLLVWLLRKIGFKVDIETMDALAGRAASYSEHMAKKYLKENGTKSDAAKKEDWAWEFVEMIDSKFKLKAKLRDKLRGMLLSKIPAAEAETKKAEG